MSRAEPKVSVVMSVYNCSRYLKESVESILNQSFTDFEFIIIDDGSTDDSWDILTQYSEGDRRVKAIKNEQNIGLTKSLNKGLKLAQGEYIARQDADDISLPKRFEKQILTLDSQPDTVLVSANYDYINSDGTFFQHVDVADSPEIVAWRLLFYNHIGAHGLTMFRRQAALELGGYLETYRYSQDYEFWTRLNKLGNFFILPDILQLYRRGDTESISVKSKPTQDVLAIASSQQAIKALIGTKLTELEVKDLRDFWLYNFPRGDRAFKVSANLKKIYTTFLQKYPVKDVPKISACIKPLIYKQFILWLNNKRNPFSRLIILLIASTWKP